MITTAAGGAVIGGFAERRWLEGLGGFAVRRHWVVFIAWLLIFGGLLAANKSFGGTYVNNYNIPGSDSDKGLNRLNDTFSSQGGSAGRIVFHARSGTVSADKSAVNQDLEDSMAASAPPPAEKALLAEERAKDSGD